MPNDLIFLFLTRMLHQIATENRNEFNTLAETAIGGFWKENKGYREREKRWQKESTS
jgi:hypothetical protein